MVWPTYLDPILFNFKLVNFYPILNLLMVNVNLLMVTDLLHSNSGSHRNWSELKHIHNTGLDVNDFNMFGHTAP